MGPLLTETQKKFFTQHFFGGVFWSQKKQLWRLTNILYSFFGRGVWMRLWKPNVRLTVSIQVQFWFREGMGFDIHGRWVLRYTFLNSHKFLDLWTWKRSITTFYTPTVKRSRPFYTPKIFEKSVDNQLRFGYSISISLGFFTKPPALYLQTSISAAREE